jgi:hypothetical protein
LREIASNDAAEVAFKGGIIHGRQEIRDDILATMNASKGSKSSMTTDLQIAAPGIHIGIDMDAYHRLPFASSHRLALMAAKSPAHVREEMENPPLPGEDESKAKLRGSAFHCLLLEGQREFDCRFIVAGPCEAIIKSGKRAGQRCGQAGKHLIVDLWMCGIHADRGDDHGRTVIGCVEAAEAKAMRDSVMSRKFSSAFVNAATDKEITIIADIDGVRCKCRPDMLSILAGHPVFLDFKSTKDASEEGLFRDIRTWGYDFQIAFYRRMLEASGLPHRKAYLDLTESYGGFHGRTYPVPEVLIEQAARKIGPRLATWAQCEATGVWPGYPDEEMVEPEPPKWMVNGF